MEKTMSPAEPNSLRNPVIAIVGATGAVGMVMAQCLEARRFPLAALRLYASPRSAGRAVTFRDQPLPIEALGEHSFDGIDIALFSAGGAISRDFAPLAVRRGAVVIDNSSAFRMEAPVPLVVPEINAAAIRGHSGIIANPNCVAIIAAMALWPLHRANPIRRVHMATYQAASGAGAAAMAELHQSTEAYLAERDFAPRVFPHPYAFNVFSHNTAIDPATGYNDEETKIMREMRKIFADDAIRLTATCIRVPVLRAHCIALDVECERPIAPAAVCEILAAAPGVRIVDDAKRNHFPMPNEASGQGDVLVGRIRQDVSDPGGRSVALFIAGDQLLKGAALNAVQIAEHLLAAP
jgi:aspartate-semialdehyde dehydrogenase